MTRRTALCLFPLALLAGCTSRGPTLPTAVEAKGKILLPDGRPLPGGRVTLNPQAATEVEAFGDVNPDGTFALTTYKPGDGACVGEYRVVIMAMEGPLRGDPPIAPPPIIPDKYSSLALSDLKATVQEGDNVCDFTLVGSTKKPTAPKEKEKEKWR